MTCRELIERLLDYVEGTATPDEFDAHLAGCSSCRAYVDSYRETIRIAHGAFPE
jgi:anti-sigma factor RsiW